MIQSIKKYTIPIILLILVTGIAYLSYYNYKNQKHLLLAQMHENSLNVVSSVVTAIERFDAVKSTMSLQKLLDDVSFGLEIFEFRYIQPDGIIHNSMFKDEIGKMYTNESYLKTMKGEQKLKEFFFEVRDYVYVMAIYYPIYKDNDLIGIIDLSVDISEYNMLNSENENFSVMRRQVDVINLLKSIEGSISNSLAVLAKTDRNDFLNEYVNSTKKILQVSLIDREKKVHISSNKNLISQKLDSNELPPPGLTILNGKQVYRTVVETNLHCLNQKLQLLLVSDATAYAQHESQLMRTATVTALMALFFALFTSRVIYYSAIEQSRKEKEKLEHLVKERTKAIEILSRTDMLTGLWNRGYIEEILETEFKQAKRHNFDITIMFIDLDHFKLVNDTYGHMAGDEVLRQVSKRLQNCLRETDFVGRYGGEELVVILPMTSLQTAKKVAQTILKTISDEPIIFESHTIEVTTSIGMSSLREGLHENYSILFAEADEALYKAKELGRNRVEVHDVHL